MWYQLVLITNLGVITPIMTFEDRASCLRESALIQPSAQVSARCIPTQSPEQLKKQIDSSMKMMLDTLKNIQEGQK